MGLRLPQLALPSQLSYCASASSELEMSEVAAERKRRAVAAGGVASAASEDEASMATPQSIWGWRQ